MRRPRTRIPRPTTLALALLVAACSAPLALAPTAVRSSSPTSTPAASQSPAASTGAAIDPMTLAGRIVFDDSNDIWSVNANGTDLRRLTDRPWREFQAALSPDGRLVAYRSEPSDYPELWIMNADGSGQRQLMPEGGFPAWSPDGSLLAYAPPGGPTGRSSIAIINPDGSGQRILPDTDYGENPSWSPDGKRIVFTSARTGERHMSIVAVDRSGVVDLSIAGEANMVGWSPDGEWIVFASHRDHSDNYRDIYVVRPDGSGVTRLTFSSAETPAWSPDGRYIVFSAPGGLGVIRRDGSGAATIRIQGVGWASFPNWR